MKVCVISDIHGELLPVESFKPCELFIICGDISPLNIQGKFFKMQLWMCEFKDWCNSLPCKKVLFIAGNHDFYCKYHSHFMLEKFSKEDKVTYLEHEEYVYNSDEGKSYKIFGTPYCKEFGTWAFMEPHPTLVKLFNEIPNDLDILITHDQPYGWGDILLENVPWADGSMIGNIPLAQAVLDKQPKYLFCGHLHSTSHDCIMIHNTRRYNTSIKSEKYEVTYPPLYLDI